MIAMADSTSRAFRSFILISAISRNCFWLIDPALSRLGMAEPRGMPAAFFSRSAAGEVFSTNVKLPSWKTVISAGTIWPTILAVRALYSLQNCIRLTPWGPNAVPTGGAGLALPP